MVANGYDGLNGWVERGIEDEAALYRVLNRVCRPSRYDPWKDDMFLRKEPADGYTGRDATR